MATKDKLKKNWKTILLWGISFGIIIFGIYLFAPGEESYSYTYFLPYKEIGSFVLTIYEQGNDFTMVIEKHRKILESIVFGEEKDWP